MKDCCSSKNLNEDENDNLSQVSQSLARQRESSPSYLKTGIITFAVCEVVIVIASLSLLGEGKFSSFNQEQSAYYQAHRGVAELSALSFLGAVFFALFTLSTLTLEKVRRYREDNTLIRRDGKGLVDSNSSHLQMSNVSNVEETNQRLNNKKSGDRSHNYCAVDLKNASGNGDSKKSLQFFLRSRDCCLRIAICCSLSPKWAAFLWTGLLVGTGVLGAGLGGVTWPDFVDSETHLDLTKFVTVPVSLSGLAVAGRYFLYKYSKGGCASTVEEEELDQAQLMLS